MPKRKKNGSRGIIVFLLFMAFISLLLPGKRGLLNLIRVHRLQRELAAEIKKLQETKEDLNTRKEELQEPETIEKIAREQYGMAKKDEKVYRVVPRETENAD